MYYLEIYRLQCAWQQCVELVDLPTVFLFFNIQALARLLAQRLTAFLAVCWLQVAETEQYLIKWDHCYHRYLPSLAAFPLQPSSLLNWLMVIGKLTRPGQLLHLILAASKLLDVRPTYSTMNRNMVPFLEKDSPRLFQCHPTGGFVGTFVNATLSVQLPNILGS